MNEGKSAYPIDAVITGETNTNAVDRGSRSVPMIVGQARYISSTARRFFRLFSPFFSRAPAVPYAIA